MCSAYWIIYFSFIINFFCLSRWNNIIKYAIYFSILVTLKKFRPRMLINGGVLYNTIVMAHFRPKRYKQQQNVLKKSPLQRKIDSFSYKQHMRHTMNLQYSISVWHARIWKYGKMTDGVFSKYIASFYKKVHSPPYWCAVLLYPFLWNISVFLINKPDTNC